MTTNKPAPTPTSKPAKRTRLPKGWVLYLGGLVLGFALSLVLSLLISPTKHHSSLSDPSGHSPSQADNLDPESPSSISDSPSSAPRQRLRYESTGFASFHKNLLKASSPQEFSLLFNELLPRTNPLFFNAQMDAILEKWGEIAPKQAIQEVIASSAHKYLLASVFNGWIKKDPDAARAFYEASEDPAVKGNFALVIALANAQVRSSPQGALDWLDAQKGTLFSEELVRAKEYIAQIINDTHPEFFASHPSANLLSDSLALGNPSSDSSNPARSEEATQKAALKTEAEQLMTRSKGSLKTLQEALASYPLDKKEALIRECAQWSLFESGSPDAGERVAWVVESLPNIDGVTYPIEKWIDEDTPAAKAWIDSLPDGDKKESLKALLPRPPRLR